MPWFVYNYPLNASLPSSYTISGGEPSCAGIRLCAIYASTQPNTDPARPVITSSLQTAITNAQQGEITEGVTKLRPNQG